MRPVPRPKSRKMVQLFENAGSNVTTPAKMETVATIITVRWNRLANHPVTRVTKSQAAVMTLEKMLIPVLRLR
ncbi:hypothetical protein TomTYG75_27940 [Sphingobium sp. TomTYG75]